VIEQRPVDALIAGVCSSLAEIRERCRALEALATEGGDDAASAQLVAREAISALGREQQAHASLRERYDRLVAEYREHRRRTMQASERAA